MRLLIVIFILFLVAIQQGYAKEKRVALVIGNASYKDAPLKNSVNDATDMAELLKQNDFSIILKLDASKREMEQAINTFGKKLKDGGVGLFYYAGHGIQVAGSNYLIPIDATIESESDVKYESVDAGRVLGKMYDATNPLNIVIMDACRNNPFARSFRSSVKGLAKMDAPTGTIIAYATAPGSVAADGNDKNGLYTKYLLKYLSQAQLKIEDVFKQVRIDVLKETHNLQTPWESSSLTGDFFLNSSGTNNNLKQYIEKDHENKMHSSSKSLLTGGWETWKEGKAVSQLSKDSIGKIEWFYSTPNKINDSDAGVFISVEKESIKNKKISISLYSKRGFPLDLFVYSFVEGYSKDEDFDSYVIASFRMNLKPGLNLFTINETDFTIPQWWKDEHNSPSVEFNPNNILGFDFNIELESALGSPSDTIKFNYIDIIN
ncbi:MAG: caspase family protein [Gammaproteobacteria bacterium]|nr:caspase family protein [Gammaproteobacteria bacterium]